MGGRSSYSTGSSSTTVSAPAPAPVKRNPHPALKHGCPASRLEEFTAREKAHLGILNRVKMPQRVAMFLGTWEEPKAVEPEPVVVEEPGLKNRKPNGRWLKNANTKKMYRSMAVAVVIRGNSVKM